MNHTENATADAPPGPWHFSAWQDIFDSLGSFAANIVFFAIVTIAAFLLARAVRAGYGKLRRRAPTAGSILAGKTFTLLFVLMVVTVALNQAYGVNLLSLVATLGIVSLALGFGLQNTVANLAAGLTLSVDRPFQVGDRIRVGTTWGDVVSIGLRSTRIQTTSGEVVAVPNALLDTQEVWNNTAAMNGEIRLEMPFEISYSSSIPLAESLAMRAARNNKHVLAYPEPAVQVKAYHADGVAMELRVWVDDARNRAKVVDRLLREVKSSFDSEGVHFPFPQRTISRLEDIPAPAPTPDFLMSAEEKPIVLACTRGPSGALAMAPSVVDFVRRLDARLVVLHTRPIGLAFDHSEADRALNQYLQIAAGKQVKVKGRAEIGDFAKVLPMVVRDEGAKIVILGQTQRSRSAGWLRNEIAAAIRECPVPVLPLQTDVVLSDEFIEKWSKKIRPEEHVEPAKAAPPAKPAAAPAPTEPAKPKDEPSKSD